MKNKERCVITKFSISVLLFGFVSFFCRAENLVIGFGQDKPPFVFEQDKHGLEIDIVRAALAYKGHMITVLHFPNYRLQHAITLHNLDGAAGVRKTNGDGVFYSDNFITFENVAITKTRNHYILNQISDLKGLRITAWQNAYQDLGKEFKRLFSPNSPNRGAYEELSSQLLQNKKFWMNRIDVVIVDKTIFQYYRKRFSEKGNIDTSDDVVYHPLFPDLTHFQVAFKKEQLRDDFNDGLQHLRETGMYQQLVDKYIK